MNSGTYRHGSGRVKVSPKIKETLLALMQREGDTGQKKQYPAKWYRVEVAKELKLPDSNNPSLRSYEVFINRLRHELRVTNPLDEDWHIGTLLDYPLPPEAVAKICDYKVKSIRARDKKLISERKKGRPTAKLLKYPGGLSIREALWMGRLSALPLSVDHLRWFASFYASREIMRALLGDEYRFDVDYDEIWLKLLKDRPDDLLKEDFTAFTLEEARKINKEWGESLTPEQVERFYNMADKIDKKQRQVKRNER